MSRKNNNGGSLGDMAIVALAQLRVLNIETTTLKTLMSMCNTKNETSFKVILGRKKEYIEFPTSNTVKLTSKGIEKAKASPNIPSQPFTTIKEVQTYIKRLFKLNGTRGKVFDFLSSSFDRQPQQLMEIANHCGYDETKNMGSFKVMLGTLTGKGIAEKIGKDTYRLTDMCFL